MAGCGDGDRKKTTNDDQVIAPPARWFCLLTLSVLHLSASVHRALSLSLGSGDQNECAACSRDPPLSFNTHVAQAGPGPPSPPAPLALLGI
jgi:hypothetical protein